jgi:HlyD family secretion protein
MAFVLFVLAGATGLAWWSMHRGRPVHYVTLTAARGTNARTATATGTINPVLTIVVGAYQRSLIS